MSFLASKVDSIAQSLLARPLLIKSVQASAIVSLGIVTGIAGCLHVWVIPIIRQARSSRAKLEQFRLTVYQGFLYLQPFSRVSAITMALMTFLCYKSTNPALFSRWKYYAAALGFLAPLAPWEINLIFPTNDRMYELGDELRRRDKENFDDERDQEIEANLTSWRKWHTGRVVAPFMATAILAWSAVTSVA